MALAQALPHSFLKQTGPRSGHSVKPSWAPSHREMKPPPWGLCKPFPTGSRGDESQQILAIGQTVPTAVLTGRAGVGDASGCPPAAASLCVFPATARPCNGGSEGQPLSLHPCFHALVSRKHLEGAASVRARQGLPYWASFCCIL